MRHINPFPVFKDPEIDELMLKIVRNVTESWTAAREADQDHFDRAAVAGLEWTKYPCWIANSKWEDGKGFKKFKFKGHSLYIHRTSCEVFNGPVPADNLVDHLCRVRGCCQHMHLEPVTSKENILRGANEAALLRDGAPPPVSAKQINPRFGDVPTQDEIKIDFVRRDADNRDIKRYWDSDDGVPTNAPDGFFWEKVAGYGTVTHILQPIRLDHVDQYAAEPGRWQDFWQRAQKEKQALVREETLNDVARACDLRAITVPVTVFEATQCYEPRRQEPGTIPVHPKEAVIPLLNGHHVPVHFTGEMPALQLADPVDYTATARPPIHINAGLDQFANVASRCQEYKHYEFGVKVPVSPTGPEENCAGHYLRNGYVPANSSGGWLRRKLQALTHWLNGEIGS